MLSSMMIGPSLVTTSGGGGDATTTMRYNHRKATIVPFEIISHNDVVKTEVARQHLKVTTKAKRKVNSVGASATAGKGGKRSRSNFQNHQFQVDENVSDFINTAYIIRNEEEIIEESDEIKLNFSEAINLGETSPEPLPQLVFQQPNLGDGDTSRVEGDNSNLSWLLNFKVASLFDPTEDGTNSSSRSPSDEDSKEGREEIVMSSSSSPTSRDGPNKPPYTYTELIEQALKEKGELTVSGIYFWISERFPFYKVHDDRWKNSVRHNLSINPHFRKGMKASQGAGHLWTLSTQGVTPSPDVWRKNRVKNLMNLMDEVAVATASIEEPSDSLIMEKLSPQPSLPLIESSPDPSLARSAEEILSGVKKQVEVQYLSSDTEFLTAISKDEMVEDDSNLVTQVISAPYLISELSSEVILTDGLFCDDLNFQCCELSSTTNL